MKKQKRKSQGKLSMVWVPQASCELSLSLGRKGFYAHRGSMSHGSWEKSANWWEFPAKFFLFCFALRALLLSTAQLWPVLLFLSKGTQALLVLPASIPDTGSIETKVLCCKCSPHCLPRQLHLKPVCSEGEQAMGAPALV